MALGLGRVELGLAVLLGFSRGRGWLYKLGHCRGSATQEVEIWLCPDGDVCSDLGGILDFASITFHTLAWATAGQYPSSILVHCLPLPRPVGRGPSDVWLDMPLARHPPSFWLSPAFLDLVCRKLACRRLAAGRGRSSWRPRPHSRAEKWLCDPFTGLLTWLSTAGSATSCLSLTSGHNLAHELQNRSIHCQRRN